MYRKAILLIVYIFVDQYDSESPTELIAAAAVIILAVVEVIVVLAVIVVAVIIRKRKMQRSSQIELRAFSSRYSSASNRLRTSCSKAESPSTISSLTKG